VIRRLLPKRLRFGEEATVVEHLSELRHRLLIGLFAIVPAFVVAFIFHEQLIDWLKAPLPDSQENDLVTLGVTEPFTTAVKVSLLAALAIALPVLLWQLWAFLAPAVDDSVQRALVGLVVFAILLPTVDPVSLTLELVPLLVLYELSIWLAVLMERRWERSWHESLDAP
jgi:sec-independent protein translocase protein TatC